MKGVQQGQSAHVGRAPYSPENLRDGKWTAIISGVASVALLVFAGYDFRFQEGVWAEAAVVGAGICGGVSVIATGVYLYMGRQNDIDQRREFRFHAYGYQQIAQAEHAERAARRILSPEEAGEQMDRETLSMPAFSRL